MLVHCFETDDTSLSRNCSREVLFLNRVQFMAVPVDDGLITAKKMKSSEHAALLSTFRGKISHLQLQNSPLVSLALR